MTRELTGPLERTFGVIAHTRRRHRPGLRLEEVGTLTSVGQGVARADGLSGVRAEELVRFPGGLLGLAFTLTPDELGIIVLDEPRLLSAGMSVQRTGRVVDVPVGEGLLGRVVDALGRPLDELGPLVASVRYPVERSAPAIMERAPVTVPLQTGIKVIDALIPVGRGQRELILGDRQTGKTSLAVDTILNQRDTGVICVYCAIGQRRASVARVIGDLRTHGALPYSVVVVASGDGPPGLQYIAPYAATSIAEYFVAQGRDVLIVYDDLTRHARTYRELSLLLRRPPGREAFPGDIFYLHSRLLERATNLAAGGSLTALPIIETEAENLSAYIPTNLISITDGQIYLSPGLFQKGVLPAVDVGSSVSRVGGKAQLAAYRAVAGSLRLAYAQFEELEIFARFRTRLDEATARVLRRGRRVRELLKQDPHEPLSVTEQLTLLLALNDGLFDDVSRQEIRALEHAIRRAVHQLSAAVRERLESNAPLSPEDRNALLQLVGDVIEEEPPHANP
jgi:F-type H+-transporting ATPase subunit alpha